MAVGLAVAIVFTATPIYASAASITLLPYLAERDLDDNTRVLTLEEAFRMAERNNSSIDMLNDSLRFIEQQRRSLQIDADNAWRFGQGRQDFSAEAARRAIRSIDMTIGTAPTNIQIMETTSRFLVLSTLNTIRSNEMDLILLRETVALQTVALSHAELRNSLGVASDADVTSARQDLESSRAMMRTLEIGLSSQRASLNYILGLPSDADIYVEREIQLEAGDISDRVRNIHYYADRQIVTDPSIAVLRRQLADAQVNYDMAENWLQNTHPTPPGMPFNPQTNPTDRASMLNALNSASRELRDSIDSMRENILQAYNQLRQLEERRATLLIDLRRAHDIYDNAVVSLAAGVITEHEVNSARLAILNAEAAIIENALAYEIRSFAFDSPFLLGG